MKGVTNSRVKLDLNRDLAFLLQNVSDDEERASILKDLDVLKTKSDLEFANLAELEDVLLSPFLGSTWGDYASGRITDRPLLERAKLFFEKVEDVYAFNGDVTYAVDDGSPFADDGGQSAGRAVSESSYVFVNYVGRSDRFLERLLANSATFFVTLEKSATLSRVPDTSLSGFATDFSVEEQRRILTVLSQAPVRAESLGTMTEAGRKTPHLLSLCRNLAELKHKYVVSDEYFFQGLADFAGLEASQILEAMRWYCSFEMSWMDGLGAQRLDGWGVPISAEIVERNRQDKVAIIKDSFDTATVITRRAKFESFYPVHVAGEKAKKFTAKAEKFEEYHKIAADVCDKLDVINELYSVTLTHERVADIVALFILIESKGDANAERGSHYGLMQVNKDHFAKFFKRALSVAEMKNPKTNITVGEDYFLNYCFQKDEERNPEENLSLAMTNFNWGAGTAIKYRDGRVELKKESQPYNYLRDLIIYERLKREAGLEQHIVFERY